MNEHFLEYVEKLKCILSDNNRSDILVNINYVYEQVYYKINGRDGRYILIYSFAEVIDKVKGVI